MLPDRGRLARLRSENHTGERIGDDLTRQPIRSDIEDAVTDALFGCHTLGSLMPFRELLRSVSCPEGFRLFREAVLFDDAKGWLVVHALTCELRSMSEFWEHSANWLLQRGIIAGKGMSNLHDSYMA